ncbi:helix-turn-helix transcriptional regulator [Methylobacterium phyllosphaerae]
MTGSIRELGGMPSAFQIVSNHDRRTARYGIAASTVRTHRKSLFAKMGAIRQKALVKLLLSTPPVEVKP